MPTGKPFLCLLFQLITNCCAKDRSAYKQYITTAFTLIFTHIGLGFEVAAGKVLPTFRVGNPTLEGSTVEFSDFKQYTSLCWNYASAEIHTDVFAKGACLTLSHHHTHFINLNNRECGPARQTS